MRVVGGDFPDPLGALLPRTKKVQAFYTINSESQARGEYVFVYPYYPMYYFLSDLRNPTRFPILVYDYNTDSQFDEAIDDLRSKHVKYILWDTTAYGKSMTTWFPRYRHPEKERLKLEQFIQSYYEQKTILNGFRILLRKE